MQLLLFFPIAVADEDYMILSPTLTSELNQFPVPQMQIDLLFIITIIDDALTEREERVFFDVTSQFLGSVISPDPVEVVIADNDPGNDK